jgi:adenylate kinase family enzyme
VITLVNTKLILIEGLPGSGKSTTAQLTNELLKEMNIDTQLYLEGNVDHPADYDTVSYFSKEDFVDLLTQYKDYESILSNLAEYKSNGVLIPRYKINYNETTLPEELETKLWNHDLYELQFDLHIELITERWAEFVGKATGEDKTYIFECCFIQNPVTIGMIKYGVADDRVNDYVTRLAEIIKPLNPILIYVDQNDIRHSFLKAVEERPIEWSEGFMDYYNHQGFGKKHGAIGIEGTLEVLKARQELERRIFNQLDIKKDTIDNSSFNLDNSKTNIFESLKDKLQ